MGVGGWKRTERESERERDRQTDRGRGRIGTKKEKDTTRREKVGTVVCASRADE